MKNFMLLIVSSILLFVGCANQSGVQREGNPRYLKTWETVASTWKKVANVGWEKPFISGDSVYVIGTSDVVYSTKHEAIDVAQERARKESVRVFLKSSPKDGIITVPLWYEIQEVPSGFYARVLIVSTFQ